MTIKSVVDKVNLMSDKSSFTEYLEDNIQDIERLFYGSNYDELFENRFSIQDLIFVLENKNLINLTEQYSIINAFLIILADYYDRFQFNEEIQIIVKYLPECSVKYRLEAAILYLKFNQVSLFVQEIDSIIEKLNSAFLEEDFKYRVTISSIRFYLTAYQNLTINYPEIFAEFRTALLEKITQNVFLEHELFSYVFKNIISPDDYSAGHGKLQQLIRNLELSSLKITEAYFDLLEELDCEVGDYETKVFNLIVPGFDAFRALAKVYLATKDDLYKKKLFNNLNRGVKVIDTEDSLYMYLYSYGEMHKQKLLSSFETLKVFFTQSENVNIVDWGCGQALATNILIDYSILNVQFLIPHKVILIEPSELALKRGLLHLKARQKQHPFELKGIKSDLDGLTENQLKLNNEHVTLHLFSNILDVPFFSIPELVKKIRTTQKGINYFICVSPNIDDLRNQRIDSFHKQLIKSHSSELISSRNSNIGSYSRYEKVFKVDFN